MAKFLKDVLYPGTYTVSDGKGGRRKVTYTRADVVHLAKRMKDMLEAQLSIPLAAEHQTQAKPLTAEERKAEWVKKLTMGYAEEAALAPEGFLTSVVEVPVEEDARRMPAVRFVSPEIQEDFVDGNGRLWPGASITHLAVTPRPVQIHQRPFQPVQMSCVRLSLTDYEAPMADETTTPGEGGEGEGGKKGFDLEALRKVLEEDGYAVPDSITDPSDFLTHLYTAALSKKSAMDAAFGDDDEEEVEETGGGSGSEPPTPASGPVMMSLCGRQIQIVRPNRSRERRTKGKKKTGAATQPVQLSHGDQRSARLEANLLARERQGLAQRIQSLYDSGRITKPIHDQLRAQATTVRLSLDEGGAVTANPVLSKVEAYEALPAGTAWPTTGALPPDVQAASPPSGNWSPEGNPTAVAESVDAFFQMLPGQKAQQ